MSTDPRSATRREFLGQAAASTAALAGIACARDREGRSQREPEAPARGGDVGPAPARDWDAWAAKLTAKHRAVFDAPEIADGTILTNAFVYLKGYREVYGAGDADVQPVLVIRHNAIPMAIADPLWEKYELGKPARVRDPVTERWARRNPFFRRDPRDESAPAGASLDELRRRGAVLVGCNLAAAKLARTIAKRTRQDATAVQAELRAHLVPGLELAPSGIFAIMRAQEAGCCYMRSA